MTEAFDLPHMSRNPHPPRPDDERITTRVSCTACGWGVWPRYAVEVNGELYDPACAPGKEKGDGV